MNSKPVGGKVMNKIQQKKYFKWTNRKYKQIIINVQIKYKCSGYF